MCGTGLMCRDDGLQENTTSDIPNGIKHSIVKGRAHCLLGRDRWRDSMYRKLSAN